jgi:pyruvate, water dikinase
MISAALDEAHDEALFGGKASQLAVAAQAGLPVPAGLALSVPLVEAVADGDRAAAIALDRALHALTPPLAARSSAVGEDSERASFAGQHATRLNLPRSRVAEAVRAIRQSARSPAALSYRRRLGLPAEPRIAVVVQELAAADCAGVLFSRDPSTGPPTSSSRRAGDLGKRWSADWSSRTASGSVATAACVSALRV